MFEETHKKCTHCGNDIPSGKEGEFCTSGCEYMYNMIQSEGYGDFYAMRDASIRRGQKVNRDISHYDWLQVRLEEAELKANGRTAEMTLKVKGARCKGCSWLIEQIFLKCRGSQHCEMDISRGMLSIWWIKGGFDIRRFAADLEKHGYAVPHEGEENKSTEPLLGLCLATTFSACLSLTCILPSWLSNKQLDSEYYGFIHLLIFVSGTISFFLGGGFFIAAAFKGFRPWMRYWPAAVAATLGYGLCLQGWYRHDGYWSHFEMYSCAVALYLWGRYLIERLKAHYEVRFVREDLLPHQYRSLNHAEKEEWRPLNELCKNEKYLVYPGELVPVCSQLFVGEAQISLGYKGRDKCFLFKAPHRVPGGSMNDSSDPITLIALENWSSSSLHQQMNPLGAFRTPSPGVWPKWGGIVFSTIYAAAAVIYAVLSGMTVHQMLLPLCAVLLIISTGSMFWARHWHRRLILLRLASYGMYVPNVDALKRLLRVNYIRFTEPGHIVLRQPQLENDTPLEMLSKEQRGVLLSLISKAKHPLANALLERLLLYPCDTVEIESFKEVVGSGCMCVYKGEVWSAGLLGWHESSKGQMLKKAEMWDVEFFKGKNMLCTLAFCEADASASNEISRELHRKYGIIMQRSEIANQSTSQKRELIIGDSSGKGVKMIPVVGERWLKKDAEIFLFGGQLTHLVDLFDAVHKHFRIKRMALSWIYTYHAVMLWLILGVQIPVFWLVLMAPFGSLVGITILGESSRSKRKARL